MKRIFILWIFTFLCFSRSIAQENPTIRINLGGYPSDMPKQALLLSDQKLRKPILVLKNSSGESIKEFQGDLHEQAWHPFSHYYSFDFSE
ncbi:MAG: glycoside hydrolase family 9, partial [Cyclobacteriaceae bacterium]|nr:glycoside hydrolase family 9 [Cyclobacteriaceae bacterium]